MGRLQGMWGRVDDIMRSVQVSGRSRGAVFLWCSGLRGCCGLSKDRGIRRVRGVFNGRKGGWNEVGAAESGGTHCGGGVEIIEHVVLYKVKPDADSRKVAAMVNGLNNLTSLNLTVHFTAGKLLRSQSSFTHLLYTRYRSMDDLRKYRDHPEHLRMRMKTMRHIVDDVCQGS
ncbi:stress-response A/B barrel domain-containing protein UP3-like protein [Tanacetum coccineum]